MNTWYVNASPLILLGKINRLPLLAALSDHLVVPHEVAQEVSVGPAADAAKLWLGRAGAGLVAPQIPLEPRIVAWDLGAGETAVLSHALQVPDAMCILDDRAARDCAAVFGLKVAGSVGILIRAKRAGLIPCVGAEIDALLDAGAKLSEQVVSDCLRLAGED